MNYSVSNSKLLNGLLGKTLQTIYFNEQYKGSIWESVSMRCNDDLFYAISNSEQEVKLHNGSEELSILTVERVKTPYFHNTKLNFNQVIKKIYILDQKDEILECDYMLITTKAIAFELENTILAVTKDSWADEGLRTVYGTEWQDKVMQYSTSIYDCEKDLQIRKSILITTIE